MIQITDLSIDDELKELLPRGSETERAELLANIKADGRITDPIVVWLNHGIVVDGQTRFDIWQNELGADEDFPHEIIEKPFESKDHVKAWMIRHQIGRRNLSVSQRSMMAAELSKLQVGSNQHFTKEVGTQAKQGGPIGPPSIESAAEEMNVAPRSVKRAKTVIAQGSESLKSAVKNGAVTVADAEKVAKLPKAEQNKAVKAVLSGEAPTVAKAAGVDPEADRAAAIMASQRAAGPTPDEDGPDRTQRSKTLPAVTSNGNLGMFDAGDQRAWREAYGVLHRLMAKGLKADFKKFGPIDRHLAEFYKVWTTSNPGKWS